MQLFNWLKNSLQLQNESLSLRDFSCSMQGDRAKIWFPEIGIFQRPNLDLGGWVDSFSRSVHLDRSTEADSGKYTIRHPAPTSPHNLSSKDATSEKQCQGSRRPSHKGRPSHLQQAVWTGDKRRFNRWSSPQLVVCQREAGYQITSKICLPPPNNAFLGEPFSPWQ